ncbi:hypothetical protein WN944_003488 [Citrus x changshan-huyou]|uniref:Uncharacterized protein n=1 Tax=Citrus x changshan-huyou TaxID=2935761 RepID=A0AAP0QGW6_9ROSI
MSKLVVSYSGIVDYRRPLGFKTDEDVVTVVWSLDSWLPVELSKRVIGSSLNLSLQEEIRLPRQLTAIEPHRVSFNLQVESDPSTSHSGHATDDHGKPELKEAEEKQKL